jgi:hypothetical protein
MLTEEICGEIYRAALVLDEYDPGEYVGKIPVGETTFHFFFRESAPREKNLFRRLAAPGVGSSACEGCGRLSRKACGRCHEKFYCGRRCQKKSWPGHKRDCRPKMFELEFWAWFTRGKCSVLNGAFVLAVCRLLEAKKTVLHRGKPVVDVFMLHHCDVARSWLDHTAVYTNQARRPAKKDLLDAISDQGYADASSRGNHQACLLALEGGETEILDISGPQLGIPGRTPAGYPFAAYSYRAYKSLGVTPSFTEDHCLQGSVWNCWVRFAARKSGDKEMARRIACTFSIVQAAFPEFDFLRGACGACGACDVCDAASS